MKRSVPSREILLLIVPSAVFLGWTFWMTSRGTLMSSSKPVQLYQVSSRLIDLSPKEAYETWDAKVEVVIAALGLAPASRPDWKLVAGSGARLVEVKNGRTINHFFPGVLNAETTEPDGSWKREYLVKIPRSFSSSELHLRDSVLLSSRTEAIDKPLVLDAILRRPGQFMVTPYIDREPHLVQSAFRIDPVPPEQAEGSAKRVRIKFWLRKTQLFRPVPDSEIKVEHFHIGKNRVHEFPVTDHDRATAVLNSKAEKESRDHPRREYCWCGDFSEYEINQFLAQAKKAGRPPAPVYFSTEAELKDFWPLKVQIPLLDSRGVVQYSAPSATPFTVRSVKVVPPNTNERDNFKSDSVVQVILVPHIGAQSLATHLAPHHSEHLSNDRGGKSDIFAREFGMTRPEFTIKEGPGGVCEIRYQLRFDRLDPPRKMWFSADIGVGHSRRVPIKIRVR